MQMNDATRWLCGVVVTILPCMMPGRADSTGGEFLVVDPPSCAMGNAVVGGSLEDFERQWGKPTQLTKFTRSDSIDEQEGIYARPEVIIYSIGKVIKRMGVGLRMERDKGGHAPLLSDVKYGMKS